MITTTDRKEIATALAKVIAYANCGKEKEKELWAIELLELLECNNLVDCILNDLTNENK